jgi:hypothetical protein
MHAIHLLGETAKAGRRVGWSSLVLVALLGCGTSFESGGTTDSPAGTGGSTGGSSGAAGTGGAGATGGAAGSSGATVTGGASGSGGSTVVVDAGPQATRGAAILNLTQPNVAGKTCPVPHTVLAPILANDQQRLTSDKVGPMVVNHVNNDVATCKITYATNGGYNVTAHVSASVVTTTQTTVVSISIPSIKEGQADAAGTLEVGDNPGSGYFTNYMPAANTACTFSVVAQALARGQSHTVWPSWPR